VTFSAGHNLCGENHDYFCTLSYGCGLEAFPQVNILATLHKLTRLNLRKKQGIMLRALIRLFLKPFASSRILLDLDLDPVTDMGSGF
jgi:hypothetical protein